MTDLWPPGQTVLSLHIQAPYEYLTIQVARLPGLHQVETIPVMRTVKRSGLLGRA